MCFEIFSFDGVAWGHNRRWVLWAVSCQNVSVFGTMQLQTLTEVSTGLRLFLIIKHAPSGPSPQLDDSPVLFLSQRSWCAIIFNVLFETWKVDVKVILSFHVVYFFLSLPWSVYFGNDIRIAISLSYEKQRTLKCCYRYSSVFLFSVSFLSTYACTDEGQRRLILFWNGNRETNGSVVPFTKSQRV